MATNYPPGVLGCEPEIIGEPETPVLGYCGVCCGEGYLSDLWRKCPSCKGSGLAPLRRARQSKATPLAGDETT